VTQAGYKERFIANKDFYLINPEGGDIVAFGGVMLQNKYCQKIKAQRA